MADDSGIIITDSIKETLEAEFKTIAQHYRNRRGIVVDPQALQHAADILAAYSNPEKEDFLAHSSGRTYIKPMVSDLTSLLDESMQADAAGGDSIHHHVNRGNRALVLCGIFPEYANRRTVNLNYYAQMGVSAYDQVAQRMREQPNVFHDLSSNFVTIADIMRDFRDSGASTADQSTLELLQQSRDLNSTGAEERLKKEAPNVVDFEKYRRRKGLDRNNGPA